MINHRYDAFQAKRTRNRRRPQARAARAVKPFHLEESQQVRAGVLVALFMLGFAVLAYRAFDLTVLKHDHLVSMADRMHITGIQLKKPRGDILARRGEQLATRIMADSVFAHPKQVADKNAAAEMLAQALQLDKGDVLKRLNSDKPFVWIGRSLSPQLSAALDAYTLPEGVGRVLEPSRLYPQNRTAAAVVGFSDIDTKGLGGLELQYEKHLAGKAGRMMGQRDARHRIFFPDGVKVEGFEPGGSIRLTLDLTVQGYVEDALDRIAEKHTPGGAWIIVMDVETGEILAMGNRPTFNPASAGSYAPDFRRNRAVNDSFEPGSTLKPLTVAIALDEGKVTLDERIFCENGKFHIGGHVLGDTHPHGWLTPQEIIQVSSNIGAGKLGLRLGAESFYNRLHRFGLGEKTGVDLPGEARGRVRSYQGWYPTDAFTISYGQGISVNSLQILSAMCALGNGGAIMRPYIVSELIGADGHVEKSINPRIQRRVVSEQVADQMLAMMRTVTQTGGTGTLGALDQYTVAGKTGTAWKVDPVTHLYSKTKRIGSFIGLVPGHRPRLGILVVVDEPVGGYYGGIVAAPAFKEVAERSLRHLGIFPDIDEEQLHFDRRVDQPRVAMNEPARRPALEDREIVEGYTPDFTGLTMRRAMQLAQQLGLKLSIVGSGIAVKQNPDPGKTLPEDKHVMVEFAPPS